MLLAVFHLHIPVQTSTGKTSFKSHGMNWGPDGKTGSMLLPDCWFSILHIFIDLCFSSSFLFQVLLTIFLFITMGMKGQKGQMKWK